MKIKINTFKNIILIMSLLIYSYLVFIGRNRYIFNMSYIHCFLFITLIFLLLYVFGMIDNKEKTYNNNIKKYILLYFMLLISVTLFIGRDELKFYEWWYNGQYKPFHTIIPQLKYGSNLSILKNVVGNSIMLIPFSFLLMIKDKKYNNIFKQSIITLSIIIGIELLQAFTHTGTFDIDDILLNYFGTIAFTFIITRFSLTNRIKKIFYTDYKIKANIKYIAFYLVSLTLILYIMLLFAK